MSIKDRIAKLEKTLGPDPRDQVVLEDREWDMQVEARFNALVSTMDSGHARSLLEEFRLCDEWWNAEVARRRSGQRGTSNGKPPVLSHLAEVALQMACSIESGPAALPPQVAKVYLEDPEALPLQDCEDCGYQVPATAPIWSVAGGGPGRSYFERCPLCGGKTGVYARYHKLRAG